MHDFDHGPRASVTVHTNLYFDLAFTTTISLAGWVTLHRPNHPFSNLLTFSPSVLAVAHVYNFRHRLLDVTAFAGRRHISRLRVNKIPCGERPESTRETDSGMLNWVCVCRYKALPSPACDAFPGFGWEIGSLAYYVGLPQGRLRGNLFPHTLVTTAEHTILQRSFVCHVCPFCLEGGSHCGGQCFQGQGLSCCFE